MRRTTEHIWCQQGVAVEGQTDIVTMGLPYVGPYNVELDPQPHPRRLPRARVLLQPLPRQARGA